MTKTGKKALIFSLMCVFLLPLNEAYSMENHEGKDTINGSSPHIKPLREELLEDGVIVRVWSGALHGGQSVGHVSLETTKTYISFWPDTTYASGHFMNSIDDDLKAEEGRDPEVMVFLRHPHEEALNGIHEDFSFLQDLHKEGRLYWALHGEVQSLKHKSSFTKEFFARGLELLALGSLSQEDQSLLGIYEKWSFNCASLVLNLLRNNRYVRKEDDSPLSTAFCTAVTPDRVASVCATEFLYNHYGTRDPLELYNVLGRVLRSREVSGLSSYHEDLFGRVYYKSVGHGVIQNEHFVEEAIERIRKEKEEGFLPGFARMMDSNGMVDMLAYLVGKDQVNSFVNQSSFKK